MLNVKPYKIIRGTLRDMHNPAQHITLFYISLKSHYSKRNACSIIYSKRFRSFVYPMHTALYTATIRVSYTRSRSSLANDWQVCLSKNEDLQEQPLGAEMMSQRIRQCQSTGAHYLSWTAVTYTPAFPNAAWRK